MVNREQTYRSALTNGFLQVVLLIAWVLALTDPGIFRSASCQNARSKGFWDGSPLSLTLRLVLRSPPEIWDIRRDSAGPIACT